MSKLPSWHTVGKTFYDISQDNEFKGFVGELIVAWLLKKKLLKLDNVVCTSLNNSRLGSALNNLVKLKKYNSNCHWQLDPVFEELLRRRNAYEVFNEIHEKVSVFAREIGFEDLDKLCRNLMSNRFDILVDLYLVYKGPMGDKKPICKCQLCGGYYAGN